MKTALAHPSAIGIDTAMPITEAVCDYLHGHKPYTDFIVRYLTGRYAIKRPELDLILQEGFALMLVTGSRKPGWMPEKLLGDVDGRHAIEVLEELEIPRGATVWLDLESSGGNAADTIAWTNAWANIGRAGGYEAGLYVGAVSKLDAAQLYGLRVTRYWRSCSRVPEPAVRGFCMMQLRPPNANHGPLIVDFNVIEPDFKGGLPTWVVA